MGAYISVPAMDVESAEMGAHQAAWEGHHRQALQGAAPGVEYTPRTAADIEARARVGAQRGPGPPARFVRAGVGGGACGRKGGP